MKLKSYFPGTVEAAMKLARKGLGEEALLVDAHPATPETRYLGAYEVVFGVLPVAQPVLPAASRSEHVAQPVLLAASPEDSERQQPARPAALLTDSNLGQVVAFVGPAGTLTKGATA